MAPTWRAGSTIRRRTHIWALAGLAVFVAGVLYVPHHLMTLRPSLAHIEADVAQRWPRVAQIARVELAAQLRELDHRLIVFDVREEAEHAISRLPGAIRIDPDAAPAAFLARHGAAIAGKQVVFYCSVGVRSARLAERLLAALEQAGAVRVENLTGGIFGWHNEGRQLVSDSGATDAVHGYDARWRRLVERQGFVRH